jgi:alpha,alpha-trehalase
LTDSKRRFDAVLLDLDGVVTRTAVVHARAWKWMFDRFLEARAERDGAEFVPFDIERDYRPYVDGKPRYDGVRSFLTSRGITLPEGEKTDGPGDETVRGLGNDKDRMFLEFLKKDGAEVFDDTVDRIQAWRAAGLKLAIVSSSRNCVEILKAAGLSDLFEARVDGVVSDRIGLKGKPAPDIFLEAARRLKAEPDRSVVLEDATSGVAAGRAGRFALVVGVDRIGHAEALLAHGADVVFSDLRKLDLEAVSGAAQAGSEADAGGKGAAAPDVENAAAVDRGNAAAGDGGNVAAAGAGADARRDPGSLPMAMGDRQLIGRLRAEKRLAIFLDYDGTLTPIVSRPDLAILAESMRTVLKRLAAQRTVAIVSGRDRQDVAKLVGLDDLVYAGSHGFDIAGPGGLNMQHEKAGGCIEALDEAQRELEKEVGSFPGILLERKRYGLAVHYRNADPGTVGSIEAAVDQVVSTRPRLMKKGGKMVFELRPNMDWDKGKAVKWLLEALKLDAPGVLPIFVGDDLTDEDAFRELQNRGVSILVGRPEHRTYARHALRDPDEVERFLLELVNPVGN